MLLNVLVYDGLIERLPSFSGGVSLFDDDGKEDGSSDEELKPISRKGNTTIPDDNSDGERHSSKMKRKRRSTPSSEEENVIERARKKKSKSHGRASEEEEEEEDEGGDSGRRQRRRKNRGSSIADSEADSSDFVQPAKKRAKLKVAHKNMETFTLAELTEGTAVVYRALFESQSTVGLGWTESPCAKCPQFDFCDGGTGLSGKGSIGLEEGPVNPRNCIYFETWSNQGVLVS